MAIIHIADQDWEDPADTPAGDGLCDICSEPTPHPPICDTCFDREEARWSRGT